jgi:hypothetical protein
MRPKWEERSPTTEWNAELYRERSRLQQAMAAEGLRGLELTTSDRVLDVGCGDGAFAPGAYGRAQKHRNRSGRDAEVASLEREFRDPYLRLTEEGHLPNLSGVPTTRRMAARQALHASCDGR